MGKYVLHMYITLLLYMVLLDTMANMVCMVDTVVTREHVSGWGDRSKVVSDGSGVHWDCGFNEHIEKNMEVYMLVSVVMDKKEKKEKK